MRRSIPQKKDAHVAQSAERVLGKDEVISSILIVGSNLVGNKIAAKRDGLPPSAEGAWWTHQT